MEQAVRIKKVEQQGKIWIGAEVPYREDYIDKIKQIPGRQWNQQLKCWLLPYSKQAYAELKALFPLLIKEENPIRNESYCWKSADNRHAHTPSAISISSSESAIPSPQHLAAIKAASAAKLTSKQASALEQVPLSQGQGGFHR
jgi:hypothetical protein